MLAAEVFVVVRCVWLRQIVNCWRAIKIAWQLRCILKANEAYACCMTARAACPGALVRRCSGVHYCKCLPLQFGCDFMLMQQAVRVCVCAANWHLNEIITSQLKRSATACIRHLKVRFQLGKQTKALSEKWAELLVAGAGVAGSISLCCDYANCDCDCDCGSFVLHRIEDCDTHLYL